MREPACPSARGCPRMPLFGKKRSGGRSGGARSGGKYSTGDGGTGGGTPKGGPKDKRRHREKRGRWPARRSVRHTDGGKRGKGAKQAAKESAYDDLANLATERVGGADSARVARPRLAPLRGAAFAPHHTWRWVTPAILV